MTSERSQAGDPPLWLAPLIAFGLLIAGGLTPLSDPDLPEHLAMGEWIVRHGAVPFVEPFAWTRAGAPYFAYSWLIEAGYYVALRAFGPISLHVLHGLVLTGAWLSVYFLGRAARWRAWSTVAVAIVTVWVFVVCTTYLRPQALLFILVPLAWAFGYRIVDFNRRWVPNSLGLLAVSTVAANTHLFFVVTALPCCLIFFRHVPKTREDRIRTAALLFAAPAGWILNPYVLHWPEMLRLYFGPNPLMHWPSPIVELRPGVLLLGKIPGTLVCVVPLLILPWLAGTRGARVSTRQRIVFGILWTIGLLAFAAAFRLLLIWWLAVLPLTALVFAKIPDARTAGLRVARAGTAVIITLLPALTSAKPPPKWWPAEQGVRTPRGVPTPGAGESEPIALWLDAHARGARGRVMTTFNYGSYLLWRLPSYSLSLDGRGTFPDSVVQAEAFYLPDNTAKSLGPWKSADLVIIPRSYALSAVLDTATGWRHVANAPMRGPPAKGADPSHATSAGLWAKTDWLAKWVPEGR